MSVRLSHASSIRESAFLDCQQNGPSRVHRWELVLSFAMPDTGTGQNRLDVQAKLMLAWLMATLDGIIANLESARAALCAAEKKWEALAVELALPKLKLSYSIQGLSSIEQWTRARKRSKTEANRKKGLLREGDYFLRKEIEGVNRILRHDDALSDPRPTAPPSPVTEPNYDHLSKAGRATSRRKTRAARINGRRGGKSRSKAKIAAAIANGKKRHRKAPQPWQP